MSLLLDTLVITELGKTNPDPNVVAWMEAQDVSTLYLSALTLGELESAIQRQADPKRAKLLADWMNNDLIPAFQGRVLALDQAVMLAWGGINAAGWKAKKPLPFAEGLMAATAKVHNLSLAGRDLNGGFKEAGVKVVDPWKR